MFRLQQTALQPQSHQSPGAKFRQGGLVSGHEADHESEGVSGVLLLELSVKSEAAQ